jgi:hypothetical protein
MTWTPWHFLTVAISGWMNRQQQVIEYLRTDNQILRQRLGYRRLVLDGAPRVRLALASPMLSNVDL